MAATGLTGRRRFWGWTSGVRQAAPAYTWQRATEAISAATSPVLFNRWIEPGGSRSILPGVLGQNESG